MNETPSLRVLLADDEIHIRAMMRKVLSALDAVVIAEAANGQEAVELFEKERPDVVLLDINMPLKNGDEALCEIKSASPDTLAIMMTSMADRETIERCVRAGAANYILKDNPLPEIKRMLRETLAAFRNQAGAPR